MLTREFKKSDFEEVKKIFTLYWTDPVFLEELSHELDLYIENKQSKNSGFFVAEKDGEIVGIVGFRKLPEYLKPYALTDNPIELYVIAVKHKRMGVGKILKSKLIEEVQKNGSSEILLYSPGSHNESWEFHDIFGFKRVGEITPPEDDAGYLWRKIL